MTRKVTPTARDKVPPPYRIKQLADELDVAEQTVRNALKEKKIAGAQLGRLWLIPHAEAMRLLKGGS